MPRSEKLAAQPDSLIDISGIPELTDDQHHAAVLGRFYRPVKQQITAHPDTSIPTRLKPDIHGYQTRLNTILRRVMQREQRDKP